MYHLLRSKNGGAKDDLLAFAADLVRTASPSLGESDVATKVRRTMESLGFDRVVPDVAGNIVGVMYGREKAPTVLLNCHMDTVGPGDESAWDESPYSGDVSDGRLHGLGAGDCKGGLAAQVYAAALLKRSLLPLRGNLVVAATVAEEHGRSGGVRALLGDTLPAMRLKPDYAVLGEPTGLGLYYGHDGWAEIEIRVEGANPFQVEDAAKAVYREFDGLRAEDRLSPHGPRFEEVETGRRATIQLDRRLQGEESLTDALGQVAHSATIVAQSVGAVAVATDVRTETQRYYTGHATAVRHVTRAWSTDPFHPLMERARHGLEAAGLPVRAGKWDLGRLGMGTAGGVMVNEFGLPTIGFGPGEETRVHRANESVRVEDLTDAAYGTAAIVHGLIGVPVFGWTSEDI